MAAAAAGVGGAGGRRFFFRHVVSVCCRVRTHNSAARAQPTKGPRKPWIAWRIWLLAWEKGRRERGRGVEAGKPVFRLQAWHCRVRSGEWRLPGTHRSNPNPGQGLVTAGYAPGHCRVRTALTLTLTGTAGSMVVFDCRVRTQVW